MARYEVEAPNGHRYEVEAPEDWDGTLDDGDFAPQSPSFASSLPGIAETAGVSLLRGGANIARGLNAVGEYGNRKIDEWFPETSAAINRVLPDFGAYSLPSDKEYADFTASLNQAQTDIDQQYAPTSGAGKYAYKGLAGAASLAPKLTMSIPGFALEAGLEGGLDRYYGQTDQGVEPSVAGPYAAAGGALDTATGFLIPKALQGMVGKPLTKLGKELGMFGAFGVGQTVGEDVLRSTILGDPNAFDETLARSGETLLEAPFMLAGMKIPSAAIQGTRNRLRQHELNRLEQAMKEEAELQARQANLQQLGLPAPESQPQLRLPAPETRLALPAPEGAYGYNDAFEMRPAPPPRLTRPEASSEAFAAPVSEVTKPSMFEDSARTKSRSYELYDATGIESEGAPPRVEPVKNLRGEVVPGAVFPAEQAPKAEVQKVETPKPIKLDEAMSESSFTSPMEVAAKAQKPKQEEPARLAKTLQNLQEFQGINVEPTGLKESMAAVDSAVQSGKDLASRVARMGELVAEGKTFSEAKAQAREENVEALAKQEFPGAEISDIASEPQVIREAVRQVIEKPGSRVTVMAVPALGDSKPAHFEYSNVADVGVNPKVFQFRDSVDTKSGTKNENAIRGPWDDVKASPIIVYEPKPENRASISEGKAQVVGDGHHRHQGAVEREVPKYVKLVLRESEGWKPEDVQIYAAENNISKGSASALDVATIIRATRKAKGQEAVDAIKRNIGQKGREGRLIGEYATDRTFRLFQIAKLEPHQARVIAETAPLDEKIQNVGIEASEKGLSDVRIREAMLEAKEGDVSDTDPRFKQIVQQIVDKRTAGLTETIQALSPLRAESKGKISADMLANKYGKDFVEKKPQLLAELADATAELARYEKGNWRLDPELRISIRKEAAPIYEELVRQQAKEAGAQQALFGEPQAPTQPSLFSSTSGQAKKGNPEGGYFRPGEIVEAIRDVYNRLKPEGADRLKKEFPNAKRQETTPIERFFEGRFLGNKYHVPMLSKARASYRRAFIFPKTLAEKNPQFRPIFDTAMDLNKNRDSIAFSLSEQLKDYTVLPDKTRVNNYLAASRIAAQEGTSWNETPESMSRAGLKPVDIKAIQAVRNTMDTSLNVLRDTLIADGKPPAVADAIINDLRSQKYVPFGRFGDSFIYSAQANGGKGHFSLHENQTSMRETLRNLEKQGVTDTRYGQFKKPPKEAYDDLPTSLSFHIGELPAERTAGALPPQGFRAHLTQAKLTPGFEKNLDRSISEYVVGLSNWAAKKQAQPKFAEAISKIDPYKNGQLYGYADRYVKYMTSNTPEMQRLRQALSLYYLGGNIKSAAVNLTQSLTTTSHLIAKDVGYKSMPAVYSDAMKKTGWYFSNPKSFQRSNPELYTAIDTAMRQGNISEQAYREITGRSRGVPGGKSPLDVVMIAFDAAEKLNRTHAFIAGYEMAGKKGANFEERVRAGEKLSEDSQFIYSKANRPEIARGKMAPLFTFRLFAGNWLRLIRNNVNKNDWPSAVGMLGTMFALGGLGALPFAKDLMKFLEVSGRDPKKELREAGAGEGILHGLPAKLAGIDISGAVSMGELAPDVEQGLVPGMVRAMSGVIADPFQRVGKAAWLAGEMDSPERAIEAILPESLRNLAVARRWATEGAISPDGTRLVDDLTPFEIGVKALGFTPTRISQAYEVKHSLDLLNKRSRDNDNINFKVAKAIAEGDNERLAQLIQQAKDDGIKIDVKTVKEKLKARIMPPLVTNVKKLPKKARGEGMEILRAYQSP